MYLKVADAVMGIGWSRRLWTKRGVRKEGLNLQREFGTAVWVYNSTEKKDYEAGKDANGTPFETWLTT